MYNSLHMEQNLANSVKQALKLIQSGKPDAARPILLEVLKQDEKIEQAWYLLSFTLPRGEKQEYALNQALRINPDFDRARERLDKMQNKDYVEVVKEAEPKLAEPEEPTEASAEKPEASGAEQPDESAAGEDKEVRTSAFPTETFIASADSEEEKKNKSFSRRGLALMGLLVLLLVIVLLVSSPGVLGNLFGADQAAATPTAVQGFRTLPPTWTP